MSYPDNKNILILLSAFLFVLSFPPSPFGFLIYIAFVPFLIILEKSDYKQAALNSYLTGLIVNLVAFYWLFSYNVADAMFVVLVNPLHFVVCAILYLFVVKKNPRLRLWVFPIIWTALEYSRQWGDLAMGWLNIAYTQVYYINLIQFADITGYLGVALWICIINVLIFFIIYRKKKMIFSGILIALFMAPFIYSSYKLNRGGEYNAVAVQYVQPNIDTKLKWSEQFLQQNIDSLISLTTMREGVVIWPETAVPYPLMEDSTSVKRLQNFTRQKKISLITGTLHKNGKRLSNAARMFDKGELYDQIYKKIKLVPAAEALPFENILSPVIPEKVLSQYYVRGDSHTVFRTKVKSLNMFINQNKDFDGKRELKDIETGISVLICYESLFPQLIHGMIQNGAEIIAVITNDDWFGYSSQPFQHLQILVLRAIENRIPVVQCANTGLSGFVDPFGRISEKSDLYREKSGQTVMPLRKGTTFYYEYGDYTGTICVAFIILLFIYELGKKIIKK